MDFYEMWERLDETSLGALFEKAVEAFPNTAARQYALDSVVITKLVWIPYKGMKTLLVKGLAQNKDKGTEYRPVVVFQGVEYVPTTGDPVGDTQMVAAAQKSGLKLVKLMYGETMPVYFKRLSETGTDVQVMCNCQDYKWRFHWWNWKDKSHFGSKPKPYKKKTDKAPVNPEQSPGICKHVMKLAVVLRKCGLYA